MRGVHNVSESTASDVERAKSRGAVRSGMVRVLFSSPMDPERRAVIAATAAAAFEPVILEDVPGSQRAAAWELADVLVCTGFGPELPPDLPSRAPRLRMVQTLLAGVDHLPFERLRSHHPRGHPSGPAMDRLGIGGCPRVHGLRRRVAA